MFRSFKNKLFLTIALVISTSSHSFIDPLGPLIFDPSWGFINNKTPVYGYVYSRGVYLNEDELPVFVIYGLADGASESEELEEIGPAEGTYQGAKILSYSRIEQLEKIANDAKEKYRTWYNKQKISNPDFEEETLLLSRKKYEEMTYTNALGKEVPLPDLKPGTHSVLMNPQAKNFSEDSDSIINAQFEVDLTSSSISFLSNSTKSVLISEEGEVLRASKHRIAYRSIFFNTPEDVNNNVFYSSAIRYGQLDREKYPLVNPISGVTLDAIPLSGTDTTNEKGLYSFTAVMSPCPLFTYSLDPYISGQIKYKPFNPRHDNPYWYFLGQKTEFTCFGQPGVGVVSPAWSPWIPNIDFPIDLTIIQGGGEMHDVKINDEAPQEVVYEESSPIIKPIKTPFDFDFDGSVDSQYCGFMQTNQSFNLLDSQTGDLNTECSTAELVGDNYSETSDRCSVDLFIADLNQDDCPDSDISGFGLTVNPTSEECQKAPLNCQPSYTRVLDYSSSAPATVVKSMTREQLRNTDIFIVRESNGQLVSMRQGLKEEEYSSKYGSHNKTGVKDNDSYFGFHMRFNGRHDIANFFSNDRWRNFNQWQAGANMNPELYDLKKSDHIKPGEELRVILINRATGYIGSSLVTINAVGENIDQFIDTQVDTIIMYPPNLKIWAERAYEVESGITAGDKKEYLIGSEGAGEANDHTIKVYSEWLDHDGLPLPAALNDYGYTGRIASIFSDSIVSDTASFSRFPIKPGTNIELLKLPSTSELDNRHYYVQVSGTAYDNSLNTNYDFALGSHSTSADFDLDSDRDQNSILKYRPAKFVPIKTPQFNEIQSHENMKAYHKHIEKLKQEQKETNHLVKPAPVFDWLTRPEYQFSVYDLVVDEINVKYGDISTENIIHEDVPLVLDQASSIEVLYNLIGSDFDALQSYQFNGEKQLILSIGTQEHLLTINEDGSIVFDNLEALDSIDVEDYLSIRLYTNNDAQNILWEYAFEYLMLSPLDLGYKYDFDDEWLITADDTEVEFKAILAGYEYRNEQIKEPATLIWTVNGDGSFQSPVQTDTETGVFDNTLIMPNKVGSEGTLNVRLVGATQGDSSSITFKKVKVIAGKPHVIEVKTQGDMSTNAQGTFRADITVRDQFGNLVEDDTPVNFKFDGSFLIKEQQSETIDGKAFIEFTGGEFQELNQSLTITAGNVSANTPLTVGKQIINIEEHFGNIEPGKSAEIEFSVIDDKDQPVPNIDIFVSTKQGIIKSPVITTDKNGLAKFEIMAGYGRGKGEIFLSAGFASSAKMTFDVGYNDVTKDNLDTSKSILVASEKNSGTVDFIQNGFSYSAPYEVQSKLMLKSVSSTPRSITLGDLADPNLSPTAWFSFDTYAEEIPIFDDKNIFIEFDYELYDLLGNVTLTKDTPHHFAANISPLGKGNSTRFVQGETYTGLANNMQNSAPSVRFDFKATDQGELFNLSDDIRIEYYFERLGIFVRTQNGIENIIINNVSRDQWHALAVKVEGNEVEVWLDETTTKHTLTAPLQYYKDYLLTLTDDDPEKNNNANNNISIGGFAGYLRAMRWYDWQSTPLISLSDSTQKSELDINTKGDIEYELFSNGVFGQGADVDHQITTGRIAITIDGRRDYIPILHKQGYALSVEAYADTNLSSNVTAIPFSNPFYGKIPASYAWGWDDVVGVFGYIIPFDDIMTVGQQLYYIAVGDWENFDVVELALASLGVLTIFPPAKPLKLILKPVKAIMRAMKPYKAMRPIAAYLGRTAKKAAKLDFDDLDNLVNFIMIAYVVYDNKEAFGILMNSITSEADLDVVIEYIGVIFSAEEEAENVAYNPQIPNIGLPVAHAKLNDTKRRNLGLNFAKAIKEIKNIDPTNPKALIESLEVITKTAKIQGKHFRSLAGDVSWGKSLAALNRHAKGKITRFMNKKNWRVPKEIVLLSIGFITEEIINGDLVLEADASGPYAKEQSLIKLGELVADIFSGWYGKSHGAQFHLVQLAQFHMMSKFDVSVSGIDISGRNVVGIEQVRPIHRLKQNIDGQLESNGKPYRRHVDLLLADSNGEYWYELKSLDNKAFKASNFSFKRKVAKSDDDKFEQQKDYWPQFWGDLRANEDYINSDNQKLILVKNEYVNGLPNPKEYKPSIGFTWLFQDFKKGANNPPEEKHLKIVRNNFCDTPAFTSFGKGFYEKHLRTKKRKDITNQCTIAMKLGVAGPVKFANISAMFNEVLTPLAGQLGLEDVIKTLKPILSNGGSQ